MINKKARNYLKIFFFIIFIFTILMAPSIKADAPITSVTINTQSALTTFVSEYNGGSKYAQNVTVTLASTETGGTLNMVGLGTSSFPFNGKIIIGNSNVSTFTADAPIFNYITTDAKIVVDDSLGADPREITIIRTQTDSASPLFAANVVKGSTNTGVTWKIRSFYDSSDGYNIKSRDFAGLIGTAANQSKFTVDFTHNSVYYDSVNDVYSIAQVTSSSNLGLICNTVGENAEVTVKATTTRQYSITSTGGHVGGFIGSMGAGSKLIVDCASLDVEEIKTTGSSKYAGGLVGYMAAGASLEFTDDYETTAKITSTNGIAGGLVGYASNVDVTTSNTITLSSTVEGKNSAGGVFGEYASSGAARTFDLSIYESNKDNLLLKSSSGYLGGIFAILSATNDVTIDSNISHTAGNNADFPRGLTFSTITSSKGAGGLIGKYSNTNLANTLLIQNEKVLVASSSGNGSDYTAGAIGFIDSSTSASYVKIQDFVVKNGGSSAISAGLIAFTGSKGNFIDLAGLQSFSGTYQASLVYESNEGVIRIAGTTDLAGNYSGVQATTNSAQLISSRHNTLVYAKGNGNDANWKLYRASSSTRYDDIGDWGQVLRDFTEGSGANDMFNVSGHTVTLAAPVPTNMASITDFAKTALNICHNDGNNHQALLFASTANNRTVLLAGTLSLSASLSDPIDLSGTGLTGLTRDDGTSPAFSGTFNGNNKEIALNVGVDYSANSVTTDIRNAARGAGYIMRHAYTGLFAKTSGATIQNITISGTINYVSNNSNERYIGSICAYSSGILTITGVNIQNNINVYLNTACTINCGGLVGRLGSDSLTTNIQSSTIASTIVTSGTNGGSTGQFSHCIGYVDQSTNKTINIGTTEGGDVYINGSYTYDTYANSTQQGYNKLVKYGGLIASFSDVHIDNEGNVTRVYGPSTVNINNLHINSLSITKIGDTKSNRTEGTGGLLGYYWPNTNVTIGTKGSSDGLIIGENASSGPSITLNTSSTNLGALIYKATGTWKVNHVKVNKFTITNNTSSTFGFIVNDGLDPYNALYLEVFSEGYDIAATTIAGSDSFTTFDEVVAYSYVYGTNIIDNGQAIISISAKSGSNYTLVMDGDNTNTYQNQTTYGKNTNKYNSASRYYYNLDTITTKENKSDAEKLLLWSLNIYAHDSIKDKFVSGFESGIIPGNAYDMEGISYYPVNINGNYRINGSTIKFYNKEIEAGESGAGNSDSYARNTIYANSEQTQHYLMHHSLFLNYQGTLTIGGQLILQGTVSYDNKGSYPSGYLISGVLGGDSNNRAVFNCSGNGAIVLDGAYVHNMASSSTPITPLLIYRIATNTGFTLENVSMVGYNSFYTGNSTEAATSLIGTVGDTNATGINLQFSNIALDARTTANTPSISQYSSTKSIFKNATLLESFTYNTGSSGMYNFTYEEDWGNGSLRKVTYGYELEHTAEYLESSVSLENKYFTSDYYVNASVNPSSNNTAGDFDGFLRYVHVPFNAGNKTHELKVNVASADIVTGCGKYNDPYVIENGKQLIAIANIIDGSSIDTGLKIRLPHVVDGLDMWCESDSASAAEKDYDYSYDGSSNFTETTQGGSHTKNEVRAYLASAYYLINNNIAIPSTGYLGLGAVNESNDTYNGPYAFRGVIVGKQQDGGGYPTITNNSTSPLIKTSNGSVVKNLTVTHNASVSINQTSNVKFKYDNSGCAYFGAVIGQIMGGDNIIDNVRVTFGANAQITFTSSKFNRLAPVGGYVGVLLNGALIFRNMSSATDIGLTSTNCSVLGDEKWLYVNPIIGRVIAGYAFTETNAYVTAEASVTMRNGVKNYSIPDFNSGNSAPKITVTANGNNSHVITLPDSGQALFLLAALINSGSCSATYNGSTEQAYDSNTSLPWIAYRVNTAVRNGTYEYVGTSTNTDYTNNISGKDIFANGTGASAKIPYAIRKYTSQSTLYRIRSVSNGQDTSNGAVSQFNFATNGTYTLPASYRGIGSIYYISDKTIMVLKTLNGNNATINFSTYYEEYDANNGKTAGDKCSDDSYNTRKNENYGTTNFSGLGLFSHLKQLGVQADNANGVSQGSAIKDLTLSGSIFFDMRNLTYGTQVLYTWQTNNDDGVADDYVMSVGGIAGTIGTGTPTTDAIATGGQFRIENITLDNVNFEGAKCVGGIIGYVHRSNTTAKTRILKNCGTTASGITIKAGISAGGLVGFALKHHLQVTGDPTNKTPIYVKEICSKGTVSRNAGQRWWLKDQHVYTAGGIIGMMDVYDNKTDSAKQNAHAYIENYEIRGVYGADKTAPKIYASNSQSAAGALIGTSKASVAHIHNDEILGVNIKGVYIGGVYGISWSDKDNVYYDVTNVNIDGYIDANNNAYFKGTNADGTGGVCGGLFGYVESSKTLAYNVHDVKVTNYTLSAINDVGGFIGQKTGTVALTVNIYDYAVVACDILSYYSSAGAGKGTGGLVGTFSNVAKLNGYNIAIQNCNINHYNKVTNGTLTNNANTVAYVVGNNTGTTATIKIVGLSIYNCNWDETNGYVASALNKLVANSSNGSNVEYFGTNGYIILTDYNGNAIAEQEYSDNFSSLYDGGTHDLVAKYPYANVTPVYNIGNSGFVLTGDGIATTTNTYVANKILAEYAANGHNTNRYLNSVAHQTLATTYNGKISTFDTEQGTSFGVNDFAVIVIDDFNRATSTNIINAFINLIANTNGYNYATDVSGVYSTNVYMIEYDDSQDKFVKRDTEANLKKAAGEFYMVNDALDTSGKMFSLIDVSFYNPSNSNEIAYHLYVPVLVKKMVKFDFKMAVLSGTNYDVTQYSSNFGITTMENLGTPITLYFEYTYQRNVAEWQTSIDTGENLMINYTKNLSITKTGNTFDSSTQMVLVDVTKGGVPYYSTWSSPTVTWNGSNGTIKLEEFNKALNGSGADFTPCNLCDLINISATQNNSGAYTKLANSTGATTTATINGEKFYFRPSNDGDSSANRYNLTVDSTNDLESGFAKEKYYISIFTTASNSNVLYNHSFTSPQSLQDARYPIPCNIQNVSELTSGHGIIRLFMGNIFVQTNMSVTSQTENLEISSTNDALCVDMGCDVKIQDNIYNDVKDLLGDNSRIQIYQSFLLHLVDKGTSAKYIKGDPNVSGNYQIQVIGNANVATIQNAYSSFNVTNIYVEFINNQSLNRFLVNGGARISSSVELQYETDEAIAEQFPVKENINSTDIGIYTYATSNIAFDSSKTELSKVFVDATDNSKLYYCYAAGKKAKLYYNPKNDLVHGELSYLGINPLDSDGLTSVKVPTIATLDIGTIMADAETYDKVVCKIELYSKAVNNYETKLDLSDYWTSLNVCGISVTLSDNATSATVTINRSAVSDSEVDSMLSIPITFDVLTGTPFETAGLTYSNFKVVVQAQLQKGENDVLNSSIAENYLVYTNAKIYPDVIN